MGISEYDRKSIRMCFKYNAFTDGLEKEDSLFIFNDSTKKTSFVDVHLVFWNGTVALLTKRNNWRNVGNS